jgi:hypothetical protein
MIAFDSPEGVTLRGLKPSRSAMLAIWRVALETGDDGWANWAREALGSTALDAELVALRFMQAARDGDERTMRQLWAVLGSFPPEAVASPTVQAAHELRRALPF